MNKADYTRYAFATLFVAIYISSGFILKLDTIAYLLLGIPLTVIFQLFVVRQPLQKLWLRDERKFYLNKRGWIIAIGFIIFPVYEITELANQNKLTILNFGYYFAATLGAFGAGYCFNNFTRKTARDFWICFGMIALLRMSWYFFPFLFGTHEFNPDYTRGLKSLLTYIPVSFVVEEVIFRGMLDTYIYPSKNKNGWWSAIFVSCLWGLWHLPLSTDITPFWIFVLSLRACLWGICLSIFWRRTGNLAVPGFPHAFTDAIRDSFI